MSIEKSTNRDPQLWRDLSAFWIIGICVDYGFHIMLVAANDLLSDDEENDDRNSKENYFSENEGNSRHCNALPTGIILLANIIPALFAKLVLPFTPGLFNIKISLCAVFTLGAYITVAYAKNKSLILFGVCLSSLSMGIGESTLIGFTTYYHKSTIFALSSGTGGAAIFSNFIYTALKQLQLSTKVVLLIQTIIPVIQMLTFWFLLRAPQGFRRNGFRLRPVHLGVAAPIPVVVISKEDLTESEDREENLIVPSFFVLPEISEEKRETAKEHFMDEWHYIPEIGKYITPLFVNYFLVYFTNQGLFEQIYFPDIQNLDRAAQYRYFQATYTVGIFISKTISHFRVIRYKQIWITSVLLSLLTFFMLSEALFYFSPSIVIVFVVIFIQGFISGSGYVNTFYRISDEVSEDKKRFAMGLTDFADTPALTLVGFITIPVHDFICNLPLPNRLK